MSAHKVRHVTTEHVIVPAHKHSVATHVSISKTTFNTAESAGRHVVQERLASTVCVKSPYALLVGFCVKVFVSTSWPITNIVALATKPVPLAKPAKMGRACVPPVSCFVAVNASTHKTTTITVAVVERPVVVASHVKMDSVCAQRVSPFVVVCVQTFVATNSTVVSVGMPVRLRKVAKMGPVFVRQDNVYVVQPVETSAKMSITAEGVITSALSDRFVALVSVHVQAASRAATTSV